VPSGSGGWQWQRSRLRLPAGTSMVSWHSTVDAGIDDVRLEPLPAVPLLTALPWARAAAGEWMAWERSGRRMMGPREALAAGAENAVHFEVDGPLLLEGGAPEAWAPDCAFELRIDNTPVMHLEAGAFRSWKWPVPAGRHTVSFVASRPALSQGTVAALELPAPAGSPLSLPADLSGWAGVSLRSHPAQPWYFTTSDGVTATMQPVPEAGPETWAELEMDGPRWVSFVWNKTATPVILIDGLRLPDSALDVATRSLVEVPGGLFVPAGRHRVRWEGTGPVTLRMTGSSPGTSLPGDPATIGLHGSFAFHLNAPNGWVADGAEHTEGSASWRASPAQSLWLPVRGPAIVRYSTRSTGSGFTNLGIRTLLDYRTAAIAPRSAVWSERTVTIPAGWHTLQWMNIGASDLLTWLDDIRIEPADAFGQWCQSRGLPVLEWTAEADSDRDGTANAIEFTVGTDPAVPTPPPLRVESAGAGEPAVLFPVPAVPATAAVLSLEVSPDLTAWTPAATAGLAISSDGTSQRTLMTAGWRFARLRAALP
jgi:hypothetical protein